MKYQYEKMKCRQRFWKSTAAKYKCSNRMSSAWIISDEGGWITSLCVAVPVLAGLRHLCSSPFCTRTLQSNQTSTFRSHDPAISGDYTLALAGTSMAHEWWERWSQLNRSLTTALSPCVWSAADKRTSRLQRWGRRGEASKSGKILRPQDHRWDTENQKEVSTVRPGRLKASAVICNTFRQCEGEVCWNGKAETRGREEEDGGWEEEEGGSGQHGKGQNKEGAGPEGGWGEWTPGTGSAGHGLKQWVGSGTACRGASAQTLW